MIGFSHNASGNIQAQDVTRNVQCKANHRKAVGNKLLF